MCVIRLQGKTNLKHHVQTTLQRLFLSGLQESSNQRQIFDLVAACGFKTSCSLLFVSMSCLVSPEHCDTHTHTHTHTQRKPSLRLVTQKQHPSYLHLCFCCFDECSDVFPAAPSEVSSPHTHTHTHTLTEQREYWTG